MRTLVTADPHGSYKAFKQCLERSNFNKEEDKLIVLGDIVDGWPESMEVIKELQTIKNLVYIIGNHDYWFREFLLYGQTPSAWVNQGGDSTIKSYVKHAGEESDRQAFHDGLLEFFEKGVFYHEENNKLFVHGGFNWHEDVKVQLPHDLMWDRHLWQTAIMWENSGEEFKVGSYDEVFIGHTTTTFFNAKNDKGCIDPQKAANIWNLDQGSGYEGVLTIMDAYTHEYWQSDYSKDLYPNEKGR